MNDHSVAPDSVDVNKGTGPVYFSDTHDGKMIRPVLKGKENPAGMHPGLAYRGVPRTLSGYFKAADEASQMQFCLGQFWRAAPEPGQWWSQAGVALKVKKDQLCTEVKAKN